MNNLEEYKNFMERPLEVRKKRSQNYIEKNHNKRLPIVLINKSKEF